MLGQNERSEDVASRARLPVVVPIVPVSESSHSCHGAQFARSVSPAAARVATHRQSLTFAFALHVVAQAPPLGEGRISVGVALRAASGNTVTKGSSALVIATVARLALGIERVSSVGISTMQNILHGARAAPYEWRVGVVHATDQLL